jgi:hypothetical protein
MKQHPRLGFYNSPKRPPTTAKTPIKIGISDGLAIIAAAFFVVLEVGLLVVLVPVPEVWGSAVLEKHVNLPLIVPLVLAFWKGSQSISPVLCMLKVPATFLRDGSVAL